MKRISLLISCLVLSVSLVGCNESNADLSDIDSSDAGSFVESVPEELYVSESQFFTISGYNNVGYCARIVNPNSDLWIKSFSPYVLISGSDEAVSDDLEGLDICALGPNEDVWISGLIPVDDGFTPESMTISFHMNEDCWSDSALTNDDYTYEFSNLDKSVNRAARFVVKGDLTPTSDWRGVDGVRIELIMIDQDNNEVGGYTMDISDCVFHVYQPIPFEFEFPQGIKYDDLIITATPYKISEEIKAL